MQVVLTLFVLVAQIVNFAVEATGATERGWRVALGAAFLPSFVLFLGELFTGCTCSALRHHIKSEENCKRWLVEGVQRAHIPPLACSDPIA